MFVISYTVSKESGNPMSNTQHAGKKRNYIGFADHTKNGCMRETTTLNSSRVANGRRRKNTILSFKNGDETVEGDNNLLAHATEFYKNLFGFEQGHELQLDPDLWDSGELLDDSDNDFLTRPFSEEEIKEALFQMEKNKAAGPDVMPVQFFQSCWEIVKLDIIQMFEDFHNGTLDVSRINYGIITLLPKVVDAEKIQQYRQYAC